MILDEKDEPQTQQIFLTHQLWCEWWIDDDYEVCDCGFREDLQYGD
jgi:hypothetical protein